MRTYPNLDVHEAFHPTSHWGGFPDRIANLRKIQNYHTELFARFVKRLKGMPEGNGTVLDNSIILFGSNMANSDAHNNDPLPQALIGQGRRREGQPAPALPAGHAAREHPGDDAAPRRRAGAGLREVRRQHRRDRGSMKTQDSRLRAPGSRLRAGRALVALAALALLLPDVSLAQARRAQGGRQPPGRGRQHAAAVGGLQGRRRRGEAAAAGRRQGGAGQQLRRHADEPRRRSGQHRDPEGAARGGRGRRIAQRGRADGAPGGVAHGQRRSGEAAAGPRREPSMRRRSWAGRRR